MKFVAVLIVAISLVAIASGVWSLVRAAAIADTLTLMSAGLGQPFSPAHWLLHWRLSAVTDLLFGLLGFSSGLAMFRRRRWGFLLWAIVATSVLVLNSFILLTGPPPYAFESVAPLDLLFIAGITAASWLAFVRTRTGLGPHSAT